MTVPLILRCPVCECDTIPLRNGICGFCDTRLVAKAAPKPKIDGRERAAETKWLKRLARLDLLEAERADREVLPDLDQLVDEVFGSVAEVTRERYRVG